MFDEIELSPDVMAAINTLPEAQASEWATATFKQSERCYDAALNDLYRADRQPTTWALLVKPQPVNNLEITVVVKTVPGKATARAMTRREVFDMFPDDRGLIYANFYVNYFKTPYTAFVPGLSKLGPK